MTVADYQSTWRDRPVRPVHSSARGADGFSTWPLGRTMGPAPEPLKLVVVRQPTSGRVSSGPNGKYPSTSGQLARLRPVPEAHLALFALFALGQAT
jgi:hypothetical protein